MQPRFWSPVVVKGVIHMGVHFASFVFFMLRGLLSWHSPLGLLLLVYALNLAGVIRSVLILRPYYVSRRAMALGSPHDDSEVPPLR